MSNGNGHRWSKFWWCDWQNDAALRMCSLGAQGYWMRALCLMHEADPVGHLTVNGRVPTTRQLAAITGANEKEVTLYTHELEENGVFSRLPDGTIYCRRMVRDAASSDEGRKWGKKGGNPTLNPKRGGLTPPHNGEAKQDPLMEGDKLDLRSSEAEAEPPVGPHAVGTGTPAEPGTPPTRRANGTNPRALGTNPRETGRNPRATSTNPRESRNNFHERARQEAIAPRIIEASLEEMAEFRAFVPRLVGGSNG